MGSKTKAREKWRRPGSDRPRLDRGATDLEEARGQADEAGIRSPEGRGRRRWQGHARREDAGRTRGRVRGLGPRRRESLRRRRASTSSATSSTRATSRSKFWAIARQRHPPRRARLLDPAPPPEGDRRGPGARSRRRDARANGKIAAERPAPSATRRRHDRVHPGRRGVLLPRDEHPGAGRALRDRDGHRRGPRREQILVAGGEPLSVSQDAFELRGADRMPDLRRGRGEDIRPGPGPSATATRVLGPGRAGRRRGLGRRRCDPDVRSYGVQACVWDDDREHASRRMRRALGEYVFGGLTTLIPFHESILATRQWAEGETAAT